MPTSDWKDNQMNNQGLLLVSSSWEKLLNGALDDQFEIIRHWEAHHPNAMLEARGRDVIATLTTRFDEALIQR